MKSAVILKYPKIVGREKSKIPRLITAVFALIFTVCAVISPKTVTETVSSSANFFVLAALPSMLPFMIASGMLIKSGFGDICKKIAGKLFKKLFGISGIFAAPLILGAVAGFPIGAKTVIELYKQGECDKEEAEKALALCSNPGFGFTVAGVGGVMWGNAVFGLSAWLSCIAASVITGIVTRGNGAVNPEISLSKKSDSLPQKPQSIDSEYSISQTLTDSVTEAAQALLRVCAFVVFFKTVAAVFLEFTASFPFFTAVKSDVKSAVIVAFFEFSSGVAAISSASFPIVKQRLAIALGDDIIPRLLTVSTLAWSGISVHMQTAALALQGNISIKRYYRRKLTVTILSPLCYLTLALICGIVTNKV